MVSALAEFRGFIFGKLVDLPDHGALALVGDSCPVSLVPQQIPDLGAHIPDGLLDLPGLASTSFSLSKLSPLSAISLMMGFDYWTTGVVVEEVGAGIDPLTDGLEDQLGHEFHGIPWGPVLAGLLVVLLVESAHQVLSKMVPMA